MGLPDNRDIEPVREDFSNGFNDEPEFVIMDQGGNNEEMEIDEYENENSGYSRLQMNEDDNIPANDSDTSDSDEDEDENEVNFFNEATAAPSSSVPPIISADSEIQAQIWNQPRVVDSIELNTEKTQQILTAMSQFKLPNVPSWAKEVNPSELVKAVLSKKESELSSQNPQNKT